ncbi:MAG: archease [Promethearchaeota archaeon]
MPRENEWVCLSKKNGESMSYNILDHTADVKIEVFGSTLEEAFEVAGRALVEVMTEISKVEAKEKRHIAVTGEDLYALLYEWLEALIVLFDAEGLVFSRFTVYRIEQRTNEWHLTGEVWGEMFDIDKHPQGTEVKAITYAEMEIQKEELHVRLQFVLDI